MTEAEWLACTNPVSMWDALRGRAGGRKLRLFGAACCRRVWHLLAEERGRKTVLAAERFADGKIAPERLRVASQVVGWVRMSAPEPVRHAAAAAWSVTGDNIESVRVGIQAAAAAVGDSAGPEAVAQCDLLRDIFGPLPFRRVPADPGWLGWNGGAVLRLAQAAYEERSLPQGLLEAARLAVLADALEEAGCTRIDMLSHLRSSGPHVRGCWAVDLLLGKEWNVD
jgi:hypothetical protein